MADYVTLDEAKQALKQDNLIELTNLRDPSAEEVNEGTFNFHNTRTTQLINSYIQLAVPSLPLESVPVVLKGYAIDILNYNLWLDGDPPEDVRRRYKDAIEWLKLVAKGEVSLGLDANDTAVQTSNGASASDYTPTYTRKGGKVDRLVW